jgi:hypothetical protein
MAWFDGSNRGRCFKSVIALMALLVSLSDAGAADTKQAGIFVKLKDGAHLSLQITLTPAGGKTMKISRDQLPWGTHESMVIVAALPGGRCLPRIAPIEDPPFDEISLAANQSSTKDIDLEELFPKLRDALKHFDVQLFWAYKAPEELQIPEWSGGWILIPKQQ